MSIVRKFLDEIKPFFLKTNVLLVVNDNKNNRDHLIWFDTCRYELYTKLHFNVDDYYFFYEVTWSKNPIRTNSKQQTRSGLPLAWGKGHIFLHNRPHRLQAAGEKQTCYPVMYSYVSCLSHNWHSLLVHRNLLHYYSLNIESESSADNTEPIFKCGFKDIKPCYTVGWMINMYDNR